MRRYQLCSKRFLIIFIACAGARAQVPPLTCAIAKSDFSLIRETTWHSDLLNGSGYYPGTSWTEVKAYFGSPTRIDENEDAFELLGRHIKLTRLYYSFAGCEVRLFIDNTGEVQAKTFTLNVASAFAPPPAPPPPVAPPSPDLERALNLTTEESASSGVRLHKQSGVLLVPVLINKTISLDFILDSGAADVSIPADVVLTLMRSGTLTRADFSGTNTYILADGSKVPSQTLRIRSLKVGDRILENVLGSVSSVNGSLLLGQSFLSRFKSWSVNNDRQVLLLQ